MGTYNPYTSKSIYCSLKNNYRNLDDQMLSKIIHEENKKFDPLFMRKYIQNNKYKMNHLPDIHPFNKHIIQLTSDTLKDSFNLDNENSEIKLMEINNSEVSSNNLPESSHINLVQNLARKITTSKINSKNIDHYYLEVNDKLNKTNILISNINHREINKLKGPTDISNRDNSHDKYIGNNAVERINVIKLTRKPKIYPEKSIVERSEINEFKNETRKLNEDNVARDLGTRNGSNTDVGKDESEYRFERTFGRMNNAEMSDISDHHSTENSESNDEKAESYSDSDKIANSRDKLNDASERTIDDRLSIGSEMPNPKKKKVPTATLR